MLDFLRGMTATEVGLLMLSVSAAILFLIIMRLPTSLPRAVVKTLSIAALGALAYAQDAPIALVAALALSAAGDFFLAFDGERNFKTGLPGFLLAQLALAVLFVSSFDGGMGLLIAHPWRIILAALVVFHSFRLALKLWLLLPSSLGWLIVAYALIITITGLSALAYTPLLIVVGAITFIVSDTLIAYERFLLDTSVNQHPWVSPAVWVTYYMAQLVITIGVLQAVAVA